MISVLLLRNTSSLTEQAAIRLGKEMPGIIAAASADEGPHADIAERDVTVSMVSAEGSEGDGPMCLQILMLPRALCSKRVRTFIEGRIRALNLPSLKLDAPFVRVLPG